MTTADDDSIDVHDELTGAPVALRGHELAEWRAFEEWAADPHREPTAYRWQDDRIGWIRSAPSAPTNRTPSGDFATMVEFAELLRVDVKTVERRKKLMTRGVHYLQDGRVVRVCVPAALAWWRGQSGAPAAVGAADDELARFRARARGSRKATR